MIALAFCALKTVVAWFVLWLFGMNLFGSVVSAFIHPALRSGPDENAVQRENRRRAKRSIALVIVGSISVTAAYLYTLMNFWGVWMAVAGVMLMTVRAKDQAAEALSGTRITGGPADAFDIFAMILMVLAVPMIWMAIC